MVRVTDPLAPLLDLADVAPALRRARERVDAALRHRALRRHGGPVAAEVSLRSAVASAALEGHRVRSGGGTRRHGHRPGRSRVRCGSPRALAGLVDLWPRAPRQVLAKLHVLAARGVVPDRRRWAGRPPTARPGSTRWPPWSPAATGRPPLLLAAVVHGELLTLRPVRRPDRRRGPGRGPAHADRPGASTRAACSRSTSATASREPEYVGASGAFATGTPDGVRSWLRHYAAAVEVGAEQLTEIGDEVLSAAR